jgi:hypothetical protein
MLPKVVSPSLEDPVLIECFPVKWEVQISEESRFANKFVIFWHQSTGRLGSRTVLRIKAKIAVATLEYAHDIKSKTRTWSHPQYRVRVTTETIKLNELCVLFLSLPSAYTRIFNGLLVRESICSGKTAMLKQ